MSLLQEFQKIRSTMTQHENEQLDIYCEIYNIDFASVVYSKKEWDLFQKWLKHKLFSRVK